MGRPQSPGKGGLPALARPHQRHHRKHLAVVGDRVEFVLPNLHSRQYVIEFPYDSHGFSMMIRHIWSGGVAAFEFADLAQGGHRLQKQGHLGDPGTLEALGEAVGGAVASGMGQGGT